MIRRASKGCSGWTQLLTLRMAGVRKCNGLGGVVVPVLLCCIALWGCRPGEECAGYPTYAETGNADAMVVVYAYNAVWDVFLDGQCLGRLEPGPPRQYRVQPGSHILSAARTDRTPEGGLAFVIQPGQAIHISVRGVMEEHFNIFSLEYETSVGSRPEIRIFQP